jgi:hypothetical protein
VTLGKFNEINQYVRESSKLLDDIIEEKNVDKSKFEPRKE